MSTPPRSIPLAVVDGAASLEPGVRQVADEKIARSPVQFADAPILRKPRWIRVRIPSGNAVQALKAKLRENRLVTVCEEASCPNIHECFSHGTATFMILGEVCTRRCSFCDVAHGRPKPPDPVEPLRLAQTVDGHGPALRGGHQRRPRRPARRRRRPLRRLHRRDPRASRRAPRSRS